MHRLDRRPLMLAVVLAGVAGFVDAAGFLITAGYFVSFMSGNSTRLGVGIAHGGPEARLAAALIGAFLAGVMMGASVRRILFRRPEVAIISLLAILLGLAGLLGSFDLLIPAAIVLAVSMGMENTIFAERGEVRIGLTYMTGALVKVGKGLVATMFREEKAPWAPHLLLWLGLVAGVIAGAAAFGRFGPAAVLFAAAVVALTIPLAVRIFPPARVDAT